MRGFLSICILLSLAFTSLARAEEGQRDEMRRLWGSIVKFEKEMPFFTKSKIVVFTGVESDSFNDAWYGLYVNGNLVKTGQFRYRSGERQRELYVGSFPIRSGNSVISFRISKNGTDMVKKFEVNVPEFRMVALQLMLADTIEKPRVVPRAWVVE